MQLPLRPPAFDDPEFRASAQRVEDSLAADFWGAVQAIGAVVFLAMPVWLALGAAQSWQRAEEARDWQPAPAKVIAAFDDRVELAYEAGGQRHVASNLTRAVWGVDKGSDWRRQHVRALSYAQSQGSAVTVFVDPRDPSRAVFVREFPLAAFSAFIAYAVAGTIFGALFARNALHLLRGSWASGERIAELKPNERLVRTWIVCAIWNGVAFLWAPYMLEERSGATPYREVLLAGQALGVMFAGWLAWMTARQAMKAFEG